MKNLKWLISIDLNVIFCKKNRFILLALLIVGVTSIFQGVAGYQNTIVKAKKFQQAEFKRFRRVTNYDTYASKGVNVFFAPSPSMVFFSDNCQLGIVKGMINSVGKLKIDLDKSGKPIFNSNSDLIPSFHTLVFIFFSIVSLYLGFDLLQRKEFLRLNISALSLPKIYFSLIGFRLTYLFFTFLVFLGSMVGLASILGIKFTGISFSFIMGYIAVVLVVIVFSFFAGTLFGMIRTTMGGIATMLVFWLFTVSIIPYVFDSIINQKQKNFPDSIILSSRKFDIIMEFEESTLKKYGKFDRKKLRREQRNIEDYWNHDFKTIEAIDIKNKTETERVIDCNNNLALLTPMTLFNITGNEISSMGYNNYLQFYEYLIKMQRDFARFWIDRVFYHNHKIIKNFIKTDENIFRAKPSLPANIWLGIIINLGLSFLLGWVSFFLLKRSMYTLTKKECAEIGTLSQDWPKGELIVFYVHNESFKNFLFTLLSGQTLWIKKAGLKGDILYDQSNLMLENKKRTFLYLCNPQDIPPKLRVKDLLGFATSLSELSKEETRAFLERPELHGIVDKQFKQLSDEEKFNAILALTHVVKRDVYLFHDIAPYKPLQCLFTLIDRLDILKQDSLLVYLTRRPIDMSIDKDYDETYEYYPSIWQNTIYIFREKLRVNNKKDKVE